MVWFDEWEWGVSCVAVGPGKTTQEAPASGELRGGRGAEEQAIAPAQRHHEADFDQAGDGRGGRGKQDPVTGQYKQPCHYRSIKKQYNCLDPDHPGCGPGPGFQRLGPAPALLRLAGQINADEPAAGRERERQQRRPGLHHGPRARPAQP